MLTELVQHVVRREPGFDGFDVSDEVDRLFSFHFPLFLSELLDEVAGGRSNRVLAEWAEAFDWISGTTRLVGQAMVGALDADQLRAASAAASDPETAAWLDRLAADWPQVRAWIEQGGVSEALTR